VFIVSVALVEQRYSVGIGYDRWDINDRAYEKMLVKAQSELISAKRNLAWTDDTLSGLGGILRRLHQFDGEGRHISEEVWWVAPCVGMVTALCWYIFIRSGLLAMSFAMSSPKSETAFNPYVFSLVGLFSGLLAKQMIDFIAAFGRNLISKGLKSVGQDDSTPQESAKRVDNPSPEAN
jgi:hypothetical protein